MKKSAYAKEITLRVARENCGLSLRKAASLLDVTHPYLSALELGHKPLREDRRNQLATLYKLKDSTLLVQPTPQDKGEFIEWLRNCIKWWDSRFILPTLPAVSKIISNLYVEPVFRHEKGEILSSQDLLHNFFGSITNYALLIQGKLGTGKSFFMRMLTLNTDNFTAPLNLKTEYVPVFISIGEFEIIPGSLVGSLVLYFKEHGFSGSLAQLETFFRQCIDRGNMLLLLDGLDEIRDHAKRAEVFAHIQQYFENELYDKNNKLIITGREESFALREINSNRFQLAEIEQWNYAQMHNAAIKWSEQSSQSGEDFFHLVQGVDSLHNLAKWPLLFHLLATLYSASGTRSFRGQVVFCDACSVVLEQTWDSARLIFHSTEEDDPLANHPLLKWKHFLIFFMQHFLIRSLEEGEKLKNKFTPSQMRVAWEDFLIEKGLNRNSIDFLRLEELMKNQEQLGPMLRETIFIEDKDGKRTEEELRFIDPAFCKYYYAKALANNISRINIFVEKNLRSLEWHGIIPLVIEELALSDRTHENESGRNLLTQILKYDDSQQLESKHDIGHFSMLTAASAVVPYNPRLYWNEMIEPFLHMYMNSPFHLDATNSHQVFGHHMTSPHLREHFKDLYEKSTNLDVEKKWRILEALCKFGENLEDTVETLSSSIQLLLSSKRTLTYTDSILMRRVVFCIRQTGRVFLTDGPGSISNLKKHRSQVDKIQSSLKRFVEFAIDDINAALLNKKTDSTSLWDALASILSTLDHLHYRDELKESMRLIFAAILKNYSNLISNDYEHRDRFIQFLKASFCYSNTLEKSLLQKIENSIRSSLTKLNSNNCIELNEALLASEIYQFYGLTANELERHYSEYSEKYLENQLKNYLDIIKSQSKVPVDDFITLGRAVNGIRLLLRYTNAFPSAQLLEEAITSLLSALKVELSGKEVDRESLRIYNSPLENYYYPIYDHLYNCLVELARGQSISLQK